MKNNCPLRILSILFVQIARKMTDLIGPIGLVFMSLWKERDRDIERDG